MPPETVTLHKIRDDKFEVGEATLTLLIESAVRDSRRERWPIRVAEISGAAFLALLGVFIPATSYRGLPGLGPDEVRVIIGTVTVISGLVVAVSVLLAITTKRKRATTPAEIVATLKTTAYSLSFTDQLSQAQSPPKLAHKPTAEAPNVDRLLSVLVQAQGVLTASRLTSSLALNSKDSNELIRQAEGDGLVRLDGSTVAITPDGHRYLVARRAEIDRRAFFGSNVVDAPLPHDTGAV